FSVFCQAEDCIRDRNVTGVQTCALPIYRVVGFLGQVHPTFEKSMDLKETYVFDIDMEAVLTNYTNAPGYRPIPRYPSVARDIAFIVDEDIQAGDVEETITETGSQLVKNVQVFDV